MSREIAVCVLSRSFDLAAKIGQACSAYQGEDKLYVIAQLSHIGAIDEGITTHEADVIIVDPNFILTNENIGIVAEKSASVLASGNKPVVFLCLYKDNTQKEALSQKGLYALAPYPLSDDEFVSLISSIPSFINKAEEIRNSNKYTPVINRQIRDVIARAGWQKLVIGLWGASNGIGKTFLAREMAVALAKEGGRSILLIDAVTESAKLDIYLGIDAKKDLFSMMTLYQANQKNLSDNIIKNHIYQCSDIPNLYIVPGVRNPYYWTRQDVANISNIESFVVSLINYAKSNYDFVIFNIGIRYYDPLPFASIKVCDRLMIITTQNIGILRSLKYAADTLKQSSSDVALWRNEKNILIVNQWMEAVSPKPKDMAQFLNISLGGIVPLDTSGDIIRSINLQKPLPVISPGNPVNQAIRQMATIFFPALDALEKNVPLQTEAKPKSKGLLGMFAKKT
ncbi:MAG: AAA family ATPase [Methylacidiphilales bacterium]|nr:AAA family ATPase [Candidatus Methylacidiphilales bacterium]